MKTVLILGSGAGGTMVATKLRHELDESEWKITVIDKHPQHDYQAGWLFIPFGVYSMDDCVKPKSDFIPKGVDFVIDEITNIDPANKLVKTKSGQYGYDWLVISTGCRIVPEEIDGMMDSWREDIHDFYTPDGAMALYKKLKYFEKGRLVVHPA